ncbi:translocation/assembly module TamB domain-containing protein [Agaribacter flavus]|uniref:Translocation/assembly module TamB domain-containing protein n=1 Tax=Agaribacter flavus TaxID=1902781 RepID=A0ABV7FNZ4_9ALTE
MMSKVTKYAALSFLSLVIFLLAVALILPSHWGLSAVGYFAKQTGIVDYEDLRGSLYSELSFSGLSIDLSAARVDLSSVGIDVGISCLLDGQICVESLNSTEIVVRIKETEVDETESSEQGEIYIKLPIDLLLSEFSFGSLLIFAPNQESVIKVDSFETALLASESVVDISRLNIEKITTYSAQHKVQGDSNTANNTIGTKPADKASSSLFSLEEIAEALSLAPQINLPEIFVPINVSLSKAKLEELHQRPSFSYSQYIANDTVAYTTSTSLLSELQASFALHNQILKGEMGLFGNNLLGGTRLQAEFDIDFDTNLSHHVSILARRNSKAIKADLKGTIDSTNLVLSTDDSELVAAKFEQDFRDENLPINAVIRIVSTNAILDFAKLKTGFNIENSQLHVKGDWYSGFQVVGDIDLLHPAITKTALEDEHVEKGSRSSISAKVKLAPAQYVLDVSEFSSSGEIGQFSFAGRSRLAKQQQTKQSSWIAENNYEVNIQELMLSIFTEGLPENLSGDLLVDTRINENSLKMSVLCKDLQANLMHVAYLLNCDVGLTEAGRLDIKRIDAKVGDNSLTLEGDINFPSSALWAMEQNWLTQTSLDITSQLNAPSLKQILPSLTGSVTLQGAIRGKLIAPQLDIEAESKEISYGNSKVSRAIVEASMRSQDNWQTSLLVKAEDITVAEQNLHSLSFSVDGNLAEHEAKLTAGNTEYRVFQVLKGGISSLDTPIWQGRWHTGQMQHEILDLALRSPIDIVANLDEQAISLSAHCWHDNKNANNQICFDDTKYANGEGAVAATLSYNLATIASYILPELVMTSSDLPLTTSFQAVYDKDLGLSAQLNNLIRGRLDTPQHQINLSAVVANLELSERALSANVFAGSELTGTIGLKSKLSLTPQNREHAGWVGINKFDLSVLQEFLPIIDSLKGDVNANIGFSGNVSQPSLRGEFTVDDGELILEAYTYPLTGFNQRLTFDGGHADISGGFYLGKGEASYKAKVDLFDGFSASGEILGDKLQFAYQSQKAQISPDIRFSLTPENIMVKGKVVMDETLVRIESLPESARSPSSDTIIIGQSPSAPILPIGLDVNLALLIDPEQKGFVQLEAMGLFAALHGDLNVKILQRPRTNEEGFLPMQTFVNGQIKLLDGNYEAYGQKLLIRRGNIYFNGEPSLPQFDLSAIRNPLYTEDDVIAGLNVTGNPVLPRVELFSEPAMTQARQLSYLLQGQDILSSSGGEESSLNTNLINALVNFGVGRSENRVGQLGRKLGFDSLNFQTAGQGENTQLQLTGRISDDLQVTYGVGVFDSASEVILKYKLLPKLFLQAKSGVDSAVNLFYQFSHGRVE